MTDRYTVIVEGRARAVELEQRGDDAGNGNALGGADTARATRSGPLEGPLRVLVDGREHRVDVRHLGGGLWSVLESGGAARLLEVDGTGAKLTVEVSHPDGEPRICAVEVVDSRQRAAAAEAAPGDVTPLTLRAPIPGRLVKVLVKAGEGVKAGQTLLVLEAMKMENELRAPRAGVVSQVFATEGVAVEAGQDLISLGSVKNV